MLAKGTSMRKITQIIRLHFESKLSTRQIAASLNVSVGVVSKYVNLALNSNVSGSVIIIVLSVIYSVVMRRHLTRLFAIYHSILCYG
jgi:DNA-binding transcriptional regulator LsrR (DeoR family)